MKTNINKENPDPEQARIAYETAEIRRKQLGEPERRMVSCYCGQKHPAEVKGEENQIIEWLCTKTGKICSGVNIYN